MPGRIRQDEQEFDQIVRGKIRKDLLKYLQKGQITILGPGRGFAIPIEVIEIPHLHYSPIPEDAEINEDGDDGTGGGPDIGVGQGPGKPGTDLGPVQPGDGEGGDGEGDRQAGTGRGPDIIEIEVPPEDFYELFKEVLELPNIKPKGEKQIKVEQSKYTDIRPVGPESLVHKKRTIKEALKRNIGEGTFDPNHPRIVIHRQDKRYRAPQTIVKPQNNALLVFMMDVSGSMTRDDRAVVRYFCALCEFWLSCNYDSVETMWIIHNGEADRVTKQVFFSTQRGGGTVASSAHKLMVEEVHKDYPPAQWNIYPIYLSDGFNIGSFDPEEKSDDDICMDLIEEQILLFANQYTYCEVNANRRWWGDYEQQEGESGRFSPAGNFGRMIQQEFGSNSLVAAANLRSMDEVPDAIKQVFKKGN